MKPPLLKDLPYGYELVAGRGTSTVIADFDFETYSPAGFVWNEKLQTWDAPRGAKKGLPGIGAAPYTEHPDAEVLSLAYNLKDGRGPQLWTPEAIGHPEELFDHIRNGGLIEAWNVGFELWVWKNICIPRYGFPELSVAQLRCAAAKSRAFCLPGGLDAAGQVTNITAKKDRNGVRLLEKFSKPRKPTKSDPRKRILLSEDEEDAKQLYAYNIRDIEAEAEISSLVPDLNGIELEFWQADFRINQRGAAVDLESVNACIEVLDQAYEKYNKELVELTGGSVTSATQLPKLKEWLINAGIPVKSLSADYVDELLKKDLNPTIKRVLQIRSLAGSSAVKKLYSMINRASKSGRLHDMFTYHKARTGRAAGDGPQPQNMPNSGMDVYLCKLCNRHSKHVENMCAWCGSEFTRWSGESLAWTPNDVFKKVEWGSQAAEDVLYIVKSKSLALLEFCFTDAITAVYGCLRSLIIAAPGHDLICSDYKAIEGVCLPMLAGEQWRIDVFNTHGLIYETSASKISGIPLNDFIEYKKVNDSHHPLRKMGKVAELASGYQGAVGAWIRFGALEHMTEEQIKANVYAWRNASPMIVKLWREIEHIAKQAIRYPGQMFSYRLIKYIVIQNILYCELPSGRNLVYHNSRITAGQYNDQIEFEGWNANPLTGPIGWVKMVTYGGKLVENIVQAVARDILAYAIVNLEKKDYPVVLHVHDEIVCEVPEEFGSIEEFETIMSTLPAWADGWPIKVGGTWRRKRYGK